MTVVVSRHGEGRHVHRRCNRHQIVQTLPLPLSTGQSILKIRTKSSVEGIGRTTSVLINVEGKLRKARHVNTDVPTAGLLTG